MESALRKLQQHLTESRRIYNHSASLRRSIYLFGWVSLLGLILLSAAAYLAESVDLALELFFWTIPFIIALVVFTFMNLPLLRDGEGRLPASLQTANKLTAIRIFLVPVVFILLVRGHDVAGITLYAVAVSTDVMDGIVARRLGQKSLMGTMLDPVGDIVLTLALFLFLFLEGAVPLWLFALLVIRYSQFFIGLAVLVLLDAMPRLKATAAGKVVGVIQAVGILLLLAGTLFSRHVQIESFRVYLYFVLGASFSSVIASQTVIGYRALMRKR